MRFLDPVHLYDDQVLRLNAATEDQRVEFEARAAQLEFECGMWRGEAERLAYCEIQWKYQWATGLYPDFGHKALA